jgi:hypothetical protein
MIVASSMDFSIVVSNTPLTMADRQVSCRLEPEYRNDGRREAWGDVQCAEWHAPELVKGVVCWLAMAFVAFWDVTPHKDVGGLKYA